MTEFVLPLTADGTASSATSLDGDIVNFTDVNNNAVSMMIGDSTSQNWWSGHDDSFYYADFNTNWVELVMPADTVAFSLSIDASTSSRAWIIAVADDGSAINTAGKHFTLQSDGSFNPEPGFNISLGGAAASFGFYSKNSVDSCNTISKVVIDPHYWGMGDFSIHVDENACSYNVPEPSVIALFAAGLFGLGFARRGMHS